MSNSQSSTSSATSDAAPPITQTPTSALLAHRPTQQEDDLLQRLKEANDSLAEYGVPGFGFGRGKTGAKRAAKRDRGPELNPLEKKIMDWCRAARVPFHRPESEEERIDATHPERALSYLDACTDQAMREIQSIVEKEFPDLLKPMWQWILHYSPLDDVYPTHRTYVFAKFSRITFDLDPKRKLKNRNRRAELLISARRAEDAWIAAMRKKMRAY